MVHCPEDSLKSGCLRAPGWESSNVYSHEGRYEKDLQSLTNPPNHLTNKKHKQLSEHSACRQGKGRHIALPVRVYTREFIFQNGTSREQKFSQSYISCQPGYLSIFFFLGGGLLTDPLLRWGTSPTISTACIHACIPTFTLRVSHSCLPTSYKICQVVRPDTSQFS